MAVPWMEIDVELANDELRVAARGSGGERCALFSPQPAVTHPRLVSFARAVERAVRSGNPLADTVLDEARALHRAIDGPLRELAATLVASSGGSRLLRRLFLHDRALHAVPWEALCKEGSSEDFWGSSSELLLARGVTSKSPWEPREVRGAVRVLAIAPTSGKSGEAEESTLSILKQALQQSIDAGEIEWLDPIVGINASKRYLFDQLRRSKTPHILHFLGHGGVDARDNPTLRLADNEDDEEDWIKAESLAQELSASFGKDLRLIVLEACEGAKPGAFGSAAELLTRAGADAVVAHLWPVKADVARLCSTSFYRALTGTKHELGDVVASLSAARRTLLLTSAEAFSPVVYLRGSGSAIFRFEDRKVSPPTSQKPPTDPSRSLAPALRGLLDKPFSLILGDRGEDTAKLQAELEQFLAENGDIGCKGLSLQALTQRCELRFGQEMLHALFQQALMEAPSAHAHPARGKPPLLDALARRLGPGVHITLLWRSALESALARIHPDRAIYVIQPSFSGASSRPRIVKRAAGASAWKMDPGMPKRFELDADFVVLRLYGGYSPERLPILTAPILTEDDNIHGLLGVEGFRTPEWAEELLGRLRMRPGLFAGLSVLEWRHRMLLRWLYDQRPAPRDSLALLDPRADPIEREIWTNGGGLPGQGRIAALSEDPDDLAAQLEALPPREGGV